MLLLFLTSIFTVFIIPATYLVWPRIKRKEPAGSERCSCNGCLSKVKATQSQQNELHIRYAILSTVWMLYLLLVYVTSTEINADVNDPTFKTGKVLILCVVLLLAGLPWLAHRHYKSLRYPERQAKIRKGTQDCYKLKLSESHMTNHTEVVTILAWSVEFDSKQNDEICERRGDREMVARITKRFVYYFGDMDRGMDFCQLKAKSIIMAYLHQLESSSNVEDVRFVIQKCLELVPVLVKVATEMANRRGGHDLDNLVRCMDLSPMLVQGLWKGQNSLLQLPHVNDGVLDQFGINRNRVESLEKFAHSEDRKRRDILRNLNEDEYWTAMKMCQKMPLVEMHVLTRDSREENLLFIDVTVILTRRNMLNSKFGHGYEPADPQTDINVHCPLITQEREEGWWLYLCDIWCLRLVKGPQFVNDLRDYARVLFTITLPFIPGGYLYKACLKSDSYLGYDQEKEIEIYVD